VEPVLVGIESGGGRVGRLRITRSPDRIELSGIQLLPHVQGRGIGTAIIKDLKQATRCDRLRRAQPRATR
jgi:GNAT superfamily N-acetyltransferase